ncbi:hypothetical protein A2U01_0030221 [Trifolium medium]|uniref:Uncharacterized protein n=1 Tax=Trifolium medium TaxID=97028 RepID=A0A392PAM6_9FABA|nr:hypothetical protein [Trifolium medium]
MTGSGHHDNGNDDLKATIEELWRSKQELKDWMASIEQETQYVEEEEEEDVLESQPLAGELWEAPVPENFKIPNLPSFDG